MNTSLEMLGGGGKVYNYKWYLLDFSCDFGCVQNNFRDVPMACDDKHMETHKVVAAPCGWIFISWVY